MLQVPELPSNIVDTSRACMAESLVAATAAVGVELTVDVQMGMLQLCTVDPPYEFTLPMHLQRILSATAQAVNVMNTHWIHLPMPGYTTLEKRLSPRVVFGKHISCKSTGIYGGDWDENPDKMLCFEEELGPPVLDGSKPHYVYMCPQEEVDAYAAGSWPINRTLSTS